MFHYLPNKIQTPGTLAGKLIFTGIPTIFSIPYIQIQHNRKQV